MQPRFSVMAPFRMLSMWKPHLPVGRQQPGKVNDSAPATVTGGLSGQLSSSSPGLFRGWQSRIRSMSYASRNSVSTPQGSTSGSLGQQASVCGPPGIPKLSPSHSMPSHIVLLGPSMDPPVPPLPPAASPPVPLPPDAFWPPVPPSPPEPVVVFPPGSLDSDSPQAASAAATSPTASGTLIQCARFIDGFLLAYPAFAAASRV